MKFFNTIMFVGRLDYYYYSYMMFCSSIHRNKNMSRCLQRKILSSQLAKKSSLFFAFNTIHWSGFEHFEAVSI